MVVHSEVRSTFHAPHLRISSSRIAIRLSLLAFSAVWHSTSRAVGDGDTFLSIFLIVRQWSGVTLGGTVLNTTFAGQSEARIGFTLTFLGLIIPLGVSRTDAELLTVSVSLLRVHWALAVTMSIVSN